MLTERGFALEVVRKLRAAGFIAYWAGGCVRDELLGLEPIDYDIATDARPEQVRSLFRRTIEVGAAFGVIDVIGPRQSDGEHLIVQVATFRADGEYSDGRRPDQVMFCNAEEDARRRDFTINGMFYDPIDDRVIDYVGGQADLAAKVLRAIGDPRERFREDKLRIMRAARMAMRFDLQTDHDTIAGIQAMATSITVVSAERIADELRKMLPHPRRAIGMRLLADWGIMAVILPEVARMQQVPHGRPDAITGTLWDHTLQVLHDLAGPTWPEPQPVDFSLAFATMLHDVGKPLTIGRTPDRYTFYGHEHVGKDVARQIGRRLKLSNEERHDIEYLVDRHQYLADAPVMRASKLKPVLAHRLIGALLALHRADALASGRSLEHVEHCERLLRELSPLELNPPMLISGDDLAAMGLSPGPKFKTILDHVREAQLEGSIRSTADALALVNQWLQHHSTDSP